MHNIKQDFPIFNTYPELIYLDNGATTQKPQAMIDGLSDYYSNKNSNIGRSVYNLAAISEDAYESSRNIIAKFVGAKNNNIVFTKGCTESINQVAYIASQLLKPKQKIIISIWEHHANILPWQRLAKEKDLELVIIEDEKILAFPELLDSTFWDNVGLIALSHVSNVTGQIHPIKNWCKIAKAHNILTCIDGAQGITSEIIDLKDIDCDFYAFSAHKLYGPMGIGVLYIDDNIINNPSIEPMFLGGAIIEDVTKYDYTLLADAHRFETGTPNVADVYAFAKTLEYLIDNKWVLLLEANHLLNNYLLNQLKKIPNIFIIEPQFLPISHMVSFKVNNIHAHDIGTFLSTHNIAVRVGKHCTHPLHTFLNINSSIRVSIGIYNSQADIDFFIDKIKEALLFFGD